MAENDYIVSDWHEEEGITFIELNCESDGLSFIAEGQPVVVVRSDMPERKKQRVRAYLAAELILGFEGSWGNGRVKDRRDTPHDQRMMEIGAVMDRLIPA